MFELAPPLLTPSGFNLEKAVELTQRRKVAETQGFRLLGTITRWVSRMNPFLSPHLPVPCAFASWRLCVNCRFEVQQSARPAVPERDVQFRRSEMSIAQVPIRTPFLARAGRHGIARRHACRPAGAGRRPGLAPGVSGSARRFGRQICLRRRWFLSTLTA